MAGVRRIPREMKLCKRCDMVLDKLLEFAKDTCGRRLDVCTDCLASRKRCTQCHKLKYPDDLNLGAWKCNQCSASGLTRWRAAPDLSSWGE